MKTGGIIVFYKNRYIIVTLLVLVMMAGGYVLGMHVGHQRLKENLKNNNNEPGFETMQTARKGDREIIRQETAKMDITTENTLLIFETNYTRCNDKIVEKRKAEDGETGLSRLDIKTKFPDWDVGEFSSVQVVLSKVLDDYCPNHFVLKDKDGMVVIYMPSEDENKERDIQRTQISINKLPPDVQDEIKEGLVMDSLEEVEFFMESLDS